MSFRKLFFMLSLFFVFTQNIFAANPPKPFLPSDNILDPGCTPLDLNCYVLSTTLYELSDIPMAKTLIVDGINGNDLTAARGTLKPFKTINAAISMAQDNDLIKVRPYTYDEQINIDKSLNFYFDSGATVDLTTYRDDLNPEFGTIYNTGGDLKINIYGNGSFKNHLGLNDYSGGGKSVFTGRDYSQWYIEAKEIINNSNHEGDEQSAIYTKSPNTFFTVHVYYVYSYYDSFLVQSGGGNITAYVRKVESDDQIAEISGEGKIVLYIDEGYTMDAAAFSTFPNDSFGVFNLYVKARKITENGQEYIDIYRPLKNTTLEIGEWFSKNGLSVYDNVFIKDTKIFFSKSDNDSAEMFKLYSPIKLKNTEILTSEEQIPITSLTPQNIIIDGYYKNNSDNLNPLNSNNISISGGYLINPYHYYFNNNINIGGTTTPSDRLHVFGDIRLGTTVSNGCLKNFAGTGLIGTCSSDERLKTNILNFEDGYFEKINELKLISYNWNDIAKNVNNVDTTVKNYGLLAQNVELIFPELVSIDSNGYKQVDYSRLPLYLLKAFQELSKKIIGLFDGTSDLFINNLKVKNNLCVDEICVTKDQFKQMIMNSNSSFFVETNVIKEINTDKIDNTKNTDLVQENISTTTEIVDVDKNTIESQQKVQVDNNTSVSNDIVEDTVKKESVVETVQE